MLKFESIKSIEKFYFFEDAVIESAMMNGTFGEVIDGVFKPAANGKKAIMQVEVGHDMGMAEYMIPAGSHVRVVNLEKMGEEDMNIEVYGAQLPKEFVVGDNLASDEAGVLVTGASAAPYLEIKKVIGNKIGVLADIVMA